MKTDKKIEEIIERKLRYCPEVREAYIYRVHRIRVEELKGELSTLIQEERKDAVEGFADVVYESFRNHDLKIHALIEEYLESEK